MIFTESNQMNSQGLNKMKSFFDKKEETKESVDKSIPFRTEFIPEIKTYFDESKIAIKYCKEIGGDIVHLMTKNQLETKCKKVFTEGLILSAWMVDINLKKKCPECFQEQLKYKRRKR